VSLGDAAKVVVDADGYANGMFPVSGVEDLMREAAKPSIVKWTGSSMSGSSNSPLLLTLMTTSSLQ
jgi:hypothetical protein